MQIGLSFTRKSLDLYSSNYFWKL